MPLDLGQFQSDLAQILHINSEWVSDVIELGFNSQLFIQTAIKSKKNWSP